jgi:mannose-1-phosphate guanylyltransferase
MRNAVVLCAGLGTRLDPVTRLVAKPAVPVGQRTLIEHVLDWLRSQGITDVVMNLHHRPETITAIVGDGAHMGIRVRYSWEDPVLGSAGGPRRAANLIEADPLLIVNGDTICPIELGPMVDTHMRTGASVTMAVVPNPAPDRYKGMLLDDRDRIRAFVPRGTSDTWHFVGVQLVNRSVLHQLTDGVVAETTSDVYPRMLSAGLDGLYAWHVDRPFTDVGTPHDYLAAALAAGASSERFPDSIVWPTAHVAQDAELTSCIVAGPVTIPRFFSARESIIVPAAVVRSEEHVRTDGDLAVFPL